MIFDLLTLLHNQPELLVLIGIVIIIWMIQDRFGQCQTMILGLGIKLVELDIGVASSDLRDIGLLDTTGGVDPINWIEKVL